MQARGSVRSVAAKGYWREADAKVIVDAWHASGLTRAAFARRHGIDGQRLARWSARLGPPSARPMRFHPVRLAMTEGAPAGGIEVVLAGGRRVRVERGFDVEELRRVLELMGEPAAC
jgi:transposase